MGSRKEDSPRKEAKGVPRTKGEGRAQDDSCTAGLESDRSDQQR